MANTIILKRSATPGKVPTTSQLALGEIAINTYDGLIYIKKDNGTPSVVQVGGVTSVNSETGAVTLTTDDISDSGQTNKWASASVVRGHLSAGTGISYNSGTGVISTTQNLSTAGSPTFAGLTLTGSISSIAGNIIPSADITYDLGSPTRQWKDIYVGPGSLYVNGSKVLEDDSGTIAFSADPDQNIRIKTLGNGILQLGSNTTLLQVDSTLQITSGKNITDSAGVEVNFGDNIDMNNNKIVGLGAPSANTDAATKKYVDDSVNAISTSSITQGNSNVSVVDTGTGTVTVTVDGTTALTVDANGVTVAGNFTVSGTQTVVNSNTINLADNIITLNSDHTGNPTQNAGLLVERGDEADVQLRWNEGTDKWTFTNDGATYWPMAVNTDDLAEGSTNLYHTAARARAALSATTASGVSYNSTTGTISLGSIPNSSLTNNSITINGTAVALGGTRTLDTDAVSEGSTNLYFTNARARGAVSFTAGSGAYNSTTGVITIPTNTSQLTNGASFITLSSLSAGTGISYNSSTGVITNTITQYTDALARSAVSVTDAGGDGSLSYNSSTGVFTYTGPSASEVRAHLSAGTGISYSGGVITNSDLGSSQNIFKNFTDGTTTAAADSNNDTFKFRGSAGVTVAVASDDATHGDSLLISLSSVPNSSLANSSITINGTAVSLGGTRTLSTSDIGEGTNLYYTDARARAALSAGTGISYNSTTGVITNTITQYTDAAARAALSAGTGISYNSTTGVITNTITQYTDAAARAALSAGTGISYNSTTGAISSTITQYTDSAARAALSFTAGSGAYNSSTGVFTIPTNTNQLTNGAGFVTSSGVTSITGGSYLTGGTITSTGTLAVDAATTNTASKIVARDANGDFAARIITATLSGTATGLAGTPNITVGTITSGAIAATGSITATGEITAYFSDERLKTDINPIEGALDKVMAIGGYTYKANDLAHELGVERYDNQIGLLAQEVEAVMPELVTESGLRGYKTIRYDKVVSVLVQAIKEQQAMIEELRQEVKSSRTLH